MAEDEAMQGGPLERRVTALEARMDENERNADDTRRLAAFVDRDQHRMERKIDQLGRDVSVLKQDVSVLKQDVSGLKQDVSGLKDGVARNVRMMNAQSEQMAHGFAEARRRDEELALAMRAGFDQVAAGMEALAGLITRSQGESGPEQSHDPIG